MDLRLLKPADKEQYNKLVTHIVQSWQWGEFRKSLGLPVLRYGIYHYNQLFQAFQLDFHQIPFLQQNVGYLPKGPFPNEELAEALGIISKQQNCAFIKVEPNIESSEFPPKARLAGSGGVRSSEFGKEFLPSSRALFTKHNFILDLTKSEEELLKNMHPKTRYNIKVAQKHGVWVEERDDDEALEIHLKLYFATTKRQHYFGHNETYHRLAWQTLKEAKMAKILIAFYLPALTCRQAGGRQVNQPIPLASWMLLTFKDTLYYPYGGSSDEYKNVMAPTLLAWEAIKFGKKLNLKSFDLWGSADPNVSPSHPWYGFTRFKEGLGAKPVEYLGTYDLVQSLLVYQAFNFFDKPTKLKAFLLKILRK